MHPELVNRIVPSIASQEEEEGVTQGGQGSKRPCKVPGKGGLQWTGWVKETGNVQMLMALHLNASFGPISLLLVVQGQVHEIASTIGVLGAFIHSLFYANLA